MSVSLWHISVLQGRKAYAGSPTDPACGFWPLKESHPRFGDSAADRYLVMLIRSFLFSLSLSFFFLKKTLFCFLFTSFWKIFPREFSVPWIFMFPDKDPSWYWTQEDLLKTLQQLTRQTWSFTLWRPPTVLGFAGPGSPLSMIAALGVYAAISRELKQPLR
eukprot:SAG31_NODE_7417_length_1694_cov_2.388715_2_plen_161_part_00